MSQGDIQKGLEQDAQTIEERMPENMTQTDIQDCRKRLRQFKRQTDQTWDVIAKAIGVSTPTLNQFANDKYNGKVEPLCKKIVAYMDSYLRKQRRSKSGFIKTAVAKRVFTLIKQTEAFSDNNEGKIGVLIGDAGHGKSLCLRAYAESNPNSRYIELNDTMTATAIFSAIAQSLKLDGIGSLRSLSAKLVRKLCDMQMIIMLDEASSLNIRTLSQLRQVITGGCACPLIISGNNHLLGTLNQSVARRGCESLDQFNSRIIASINLDELAAGDGGGLYSTEDIRKLYAHGGVRLTRDGAASLKRICMTPGSGRLRTCSHIIEAIKLSPNVNAAEGIDQMLILSAIKDLGLDAFLHLPLTTLTDDDEHIEKVAQTA